MPGPHAEIPAELVLADLPPLYVGIVGQIVGDTGEHAVVMEVDDPLGLGEGERLEQDAVHDAEHRGGRADAEPERQHDR